MYEQRTGHSIIILHGGCYRKMCAEFLPNLFSQVVLLLAVINAELIPETKEVPQNVTNFQHDSTENGTTHTQDLKIDNGLPYYRNSRQVPTLFQNKQPGFSSSFLNKLNTYGLAITGNIGLGVRYASGNSYNGDGGLPHQNYRENTNNVYDRYLGTTFNIGTNLHMLNKGDDHSSYSNGLANRKDDDTAKELKSDNSTSKQTVWKRLNQYFPKAKSSDSFNGTIFDCSESQDFGNCTGITSNNGNTNTLTRLFNKYFPKSEPRKITDNRTIEEKSQTLQKAFGDTDVDQNNANLSTKVIKYFDRFRFSSIVEQIWSDRNNIFPKSNDSEAVKNDYNTFRNMVRVFLVERISSYISQNSTNENFVQKFVKKALSQMMVDSQTQETKDQPLDERNTWWKYLSEYFNNEKLKKVFPGLETLRNNFASPQWPEYEGNYASGWLKNNFSNRFNKYLNGNTSQL